MSWNPSDYLTFGGERTRPAADLLMRVPLDAPRRIADLGCGPGNSTALLAARWPGAEIEGIDSAPEMITRAEREGPKGVRWRLADAQAWMPAGDLDLLYSNALLQWLPGWDHRVEDWLAALQPGAVLALQVPRNFAAPSHNEIRAAASDPRWAEHLLHARLPIADAEPAVLAARLSPLAALDIWETEYLHILDGEDAVYRWVSGTALTAYAGLLPPGEDADFHAEVRARLARAYPRGADGRTLFAFRRLFLVARRR